MPIKAQLLKNDQKLHKNLDYIEISFRAQFIEKNSKFYLVVCILQVAISDRFLCNGVRHQTSIGSTFIQFQQSHSTV